MDGRDDPANHQTPKQPISDNIVNLHPAVTPLSDMMRDMSQMKSS